MSLEIKQIITQIIAFLIMLWILKRYAWKPLLNLMDERTKKIQSLFDEIAEKNLLVDLRMSEYETRISEIKNEGQAIIQNSVKDARKIAQDLQIESQRKAHDILNKAQEEAKRELSKAKVEMKKEIVNLALLTFEKLMHMKLTKEEIDQYGTKLLDEV